MLLVAVEGQADNRPLSTQAWDQLLPGNRFSDIADFNRTVTQEGKERIYAFSASAEDGSLLISVVIAVGPVGARLHPASWKIAVSKASEADRAHDFPDIGSRAQLQRSGFSPEGALSSVVFATSDERFDVMVSVFEASSAIPRGDLTAIDVARRIEKAYDDAVE